METLMRPNHPEELQQSIGRSRKARYYRGVSDRPERTLGGWCMSNPWEDEETWEEDRHRRLREPLEIRFSIHPAKLWNDSEHRANAKGLLKALLELPQEKRYLALKRS